MDQKIQNSFDCVRKDMDRAKQAIKIFAITQGIAIIVIGFGLLSIYQKVGA